MTYCMMTHWMAHWMTHDQAEALPGEHRRAEERAQLARLRPSQIGECTSPLQHHQQFVHDAHLRRPAAPAVATTAAAFA